MVVAPLLRRAALVFNSKTAPQTAASSPGIELMFNPTENAAIDIEHSIEFFARVPHGGLVAPPPPKPRGGPAALVGERSEPEGSVYVGHMHCSVQSGSRAETGDGSNYFLGLFRGSSPPTRPVRHFKPDESSARPEDTTCQKPCRS